MTQEEKDYETWETATRDIRMQREQGYKGKKYRIYPKIVYDGVKQDRWGYFRKKHHYTVSKVERLKSTSMGQVHKAERRLKKKENK